MYDVVIIGAGISGAMTAYRLSEYNIKIAVLEAGADVASGTTRANSAIIHAGYDAKEGSLKAKLNVLGCAQMENICKTLDVAYEKCGSLVIGFSDKDRAHIEMLKKRGETNGVKGLRIVEKEELHQMEPNVAEDATCALLAPSAGIVCPFDLAFAICENSCVNGADFFFDFRVSGIKRENGFFTVTDGKREVEAKYVVNAAGLYADEIAKMVDDPLPFEIIPRRGEYMLLDKNEGDMVKRTLFVTPSDKGKGILVSRTADGNIILGPNANLVFDKADTSVTEEGIEEITEGAKRLTPNINLKAVITSFAGVRPTPTSGDFYICESNKVKGFVNVAGIESPGLASSPAIGEYVKEILEKAGLKLERKENYIKTRTKNGNCKLFCRMTDEEKEEAIKRNPLYARVVCRCEKITEGDIVEAIHRPIPAHTVDMVKRRTRAGMGRCQGGFCRTSVAEIIARELNIPLSEVKKFGEHSNILIGRTK